MRLTEACATGACSFGAPLVFAALTSTVIQTEGRATVRILIAALMRARPASSMRGAIMLVCFGWGDAPRVPAGFRASMLVAEGRAAHCHHGTAFLLAHLASSVLTAKVGAALCTFHAVFVRTSLASSV